MFRISLKIQNGSAFDKIFKIFNKFFFFFFFFFFAILIKFASKGVVCQDFSFQMYSLSTLFFPLTPFHSDYKV